MSSTNGFHLEEVAKVLSGSPELHRQRRPTAAHGIAVSASRRVIAAAQASVMKEVLSRFIVDVYERDDAGRLWNIAPTCRIDIPVPWGRHGYRRWGVQRTHAEIMRYSLMQMQGKRIPFLFSDFDRRWYLDTDRYPDAENALGWLDEFNLNAELWSAMMDAWKKGKR